MTTRFRQRGSMEQRRQDVNRVNAMTVQVTRGTCRILVVGAGEVAVDIPFPVVFGELPNFGYGGEMNTNHRVTAGTYPTISAIVTAWETVSDDPLAHERYVGASIAVVTTGNTDQEVWLHYSFEGKAMRNPLNTIDGSDDTI